MKNSKVFENVSYGSHKRNVLDLYIPGDAKGELGIVLCIHGGSWISGDKSSYTEVAQHMCRDLSLGGATVNYRYLSADTTMHDIIDDIDAAVRKIKELGEENGVRFNRIILGGHSAGAHLSMLYAYSKKDSAPVTPVAVINQSGPTDFNDEAFYTSTCMSTESIEHLISCALGKKVRVEQVKELREELGSISPVDFADESTVPTLICHGDLDNVVPYSNAVTLDKVLTRYGVKHDFITYDAGHDLNDRAASKTASKFIHGYIADYLK